jgi:hypothetical protein
MVNNKKICSYEKIIVHHIIRFIGNLRTDGGAGEVCRGGKGVDLLQDNTSSVYALLFPFHSGRHYHGWKGMQEAIWRPL